MKWKVEMLTNLGETAKAVVSIGKRLEELDTEGWELVQVVTYGKDEDLVLIARKRD